MTTEVPCGLIRSILRHRRRREGLADAKANLGLMEQTRLLIFLQLSRKRVEGFPASGDLG